MSPALLALLLPLIAGVALMAPAHFILLGDQLLAWMNGQWNLAGVRFDMTDLFVGGFVVMLAVRSRSVLQGGFVPHRRLWMLLGIWICLAYALAPVNAPSLTNPATILYQLYRYCWRDLLYFPLACLLLTDRHRVRQVLLAVVTIGAIFSARAIQQALTGRDAVGYFSTGNALGACLLAPIIVAAGMLIQSESRNRFIIGGLGLLVIARGLLFSGSRGAMAGATAGLFVMGASFWWLGIVRARLYRFAILGMLGLALVLVANPGILRRGTVQRAATLLDPSEVNTLNWRVQERWPHFWRLSLENPWLGTGESMDRSLGTFANTPHNAYLAISVKYGFLVLGLYLFFAWHGLRSSLRIMRHRQADSWTRCIGITTAAVLVAVLVHGLVESVLNESFVLKMYWLMVGVATTTWTRLRRGEELPESLSAQSADGRRSAGASRLTATS